MRYVPVLSLVTFVLTACGQQASTLTVDALAHDPQRFYALRDRCAMARGHREDAMCRVVDSAYARRFFLGLGGPSEYQTLASLPPIPASFDADDGARP
ncbi:hypothetical protein [Pandoraea sputorum]|uniref:hypothetical protein n=1 Tax=Pandoraea sputorum TaxID=93222 RepID=UPI00123EF557|nr:hypothetical protein [Pandoraea sputorum]VVE82959.1 entry exclusion lipoprotein TrbK [Pandoraea sputorum]